MENLKQSEINNLMNENKIKVRDPKANSLNFLTRFFITKSQHNDLELVEFNDKNVDTNIPAERDSDGEERVRWDSFTEYFLSIIGFVIDLGFKFKFKNN